MPPGRSCEAKRTKPSERKSEGRRGDKERAERPLPSPATDPFHPKKKTKTVVAVEGATTLLRTSRFFFLYSSPRSLPHLVSGLTMRVGGEDQTGCLSRFGLEEEKRKKDEGRNGEDQRKRGKTKTTEHGRGRRRNAKKG